MKHKIIFLVTLSLIFINACCSLDRIGNLISPKSKEEMKELFFQEIISPQLTPNICYLNYSTNNFYYPTMLEYVEEFENNDDIIFSLLWPYPPKQIFIAVTAIKDNSQYDLIMTVGRGKKITEKGIKIFSAEEFTVLLDSINNISAEIENIFGTKSYGFDNIKLNGADYLENNFKGLIINTKSNYITFFPANTQFLSGDLAGRYGKCFLGIWDLFNEIDYKWLIKYR